MAYVVVKYINGNPYKYLVKSVREGSKVRQVFIRYLGRADGAENGNYETELDEFNNKTHVTVPNKRLGLNNIEPKIIWIDTWRDIYGVDLNTVAQYDPGKDVIYALKGEATQQVIQHEIGHAISSHSGRQKKTWEGITPSMYVRDELEADKYAYDKTGESDIMTTLESLDDDLVYTEYKLSPSEALDILQNELRAINPPQKWLDSFEQYKKKRIEFIEEGSFSSLEEEHLKQPKRRLEKADKFTGWDIPESEYYDVVQEMDISPDVLSKISLPTIMITEDLTSPIFVITDEVPSGAVIAVPTSILEKYEYKEDKDEIEFELGKEGKDAIKRQIEHYLEHLVASGKLESLKVATLKPE